MNSLAHAVLAALVAGSAVVQPARAAVDPAFGDWLVESKNGKIRVAACAADPTTACGTLIWAAPPPEAPPGPLHDARNPDPALRGRLLLGVLIVRDFRRVSEGHWEDGKIYDPESGRTYGSRMVAGPDGTLKVSGCVLVFCKTETWTRVGP